MQMTSNVTLAASRIKMLIMDVDGVLTDGGLYYDDKGRVMKKFHVHDGLGIKLAQAAGLKLAVITGLESRAVESRIKELGIKHYFYGQTNKIPLLEQLSRDENISFQQMAYLGDDWVDASPMLKVGLPMAVANAQPEILELAKWISPRHGGCGAARDAIMLILSSQNKIQQQWQHWISLT